MNITDKLFLFNAIGLVGLAALIIINPYQSKNPVITNKLELNTICLNGVEYYYNRYGFMSVKYDTDSKVSLCVKGKNL